MEDRKRRLYRGALAAFFGVMTLFTILSRIVDARETAKVKLTYAGRGNVTKTVRGSGTVEAGSEIGIRLTPGLRVGEIAALTGTFVREGDLLFRYTQDSILERLEEVSKEIRRLELEMEQETIRANSFQGVTEAGAAEQALDFARKEQERLSRKEREAIAEYERQAERLRSYYKKRLDLSEEELIRASYGDYAMSRTDYKSAKLDRDSQVKEIERDIKEAETAIKRLEKKREKAQDKADSDAATEEDAAALLQIEEEIEDFEERLKELLEDLEDTKDSMDLKVERAREEMEEKEDIYDRAGGEADSARLALKESYENGLRQEFGLVKSAEDAREAADRAVEAALLELENARKNDRARELSAQQAKHLAALQNEARRLDLEDYQKEQAALTALLDAGGAVKAEMSGSVTRVELETGKATDGSERFLLSSGDFRFTGSFDREEQGSVQAGEEIDITLEGETHPVPSVVSQVDLVSDPETGTLTAPLEGGAAALGQKASFEVKRSGEIYNTVIPAAALRKDTEGWYCLAARRQKTILGEEYRAVRIDLRLLLAGDASAAVEGALSAEEPIITGSDRVINAGDRVRPLSDLLE